LARTPGLTQTCTPWWTASSQALGGSGHEAGYLAGVDFKVNLWLVRKLARECMAPDDFQIADAKCRNFGDILRFWSDVLTGTRRMVIDWNRSSHGWKPCFREKDKVACCEHGCGRCESVLLLYIEQVTLTEKLVWPPAGWTPPLTKEQFKQLTAIPEAEEFAAAVDIAPDGRRIMAHIVTTKNVDEAMRFEDLHAMHATWTKVDPRCPVRPDGKPNRPLTAFGFETEKIPDPNSEAKENQ